MASAHVVVATPPSDVLNMLPQDTWHHPPPSASQQAAAALGGVSDGALAILRARAEAAEARAVAAEARAAAAEARAKAAEKRNYLPVQQHQDRPLQHQNRHQQMRRHEPWNCNATATTITPLRPAIVVSGSRARYERVAAMLCAYGFSAERSPAFYANFTTKCRGMNGHRLAMRRAWRTIAERQQPMALFEDDVVVATSRSSSHPVSAHEMTRQIHAYISTHESQYDVLWLGGLGRLDLCAKASRMDGSCPQVHLPYNGEKVYGADSQSAQSKDRLLPAIASLFTDHAKWITPRGATLQLRCTESCIATAMWSVDSITARVCNDSAFSPIYRNAKGNGASRYKALVDFRREFCDWGHRGPLAGDEDLRCLRPPSNYWEVIPDEGPPVKDASLVFKKPKVKKEKLFMGFFWQMQKATGANQSVSAHDAARQKWIEQVVNTTLASRERARRIKAERAEKAASKRANATGAVA